MNFLMSLLQKFSSNIQEAHSLTGLDLRDPSTIPLNFTKSINLAISERGINAMRHAGQPGLLGHVMSTTIPMRGRMIHGRGPTGALFEQSQDYDVKGRVCIITSTPVWHVKLTIPNRQFTPLIAQA
jgi:kynurenine 3-monooxygenase